MAFQPKSVAHRRFLKVQDQPAIMLQFHWQIPSKRLAGIIRKVLLLERNKGEWVDFLTFQLPLRQMVMMHYMYVWHWKKRTNQTNKRIHGMFCFKHEMRKALRKKKTFIVCSWWKAKGNKPILLISLDDAFLPHLIMKFCSCETSNIPNSHWKIYRFVTWNLKATHLNWIAVWIEIMIRQTKTQTKMIKLATSNCV